MDDADNSPLELGSSFTTDCDGAEGFPEDVLADVGSNEEGDARSHPVSCLEHLIQHDDNAPGKGQLEYDYYSIAKADFLNGPITP